MISTKRIISVLTVLLVVMIVPVRALAEFVLVERVINGDTFITSDGTQVKISGINISETKHPTQGEAIDDQAATELAKFFLQGNTVWIVGNTIDNYERRVAKVRLSGGKLYSDIVKEYGYDKETKSIYILPTDTTPKTIITRNPYIKTLSSDSSSSRTTMTYPSDIVTATPVYVPTQSSGSSSSDGKTVFVKGYTKKNGMYVSPHYRRPPER